MVISQLSNAIETNSFVHYMHNLNFLAHIERIYFQSQKIILSNAHVCGVTVRNHKIYRIDWILHQMISSDMSDVLRPAAIHFVKHDVSLKQKYVELT